MSEKNNVKWADLNKLSGIKVSLPVGILSLHNVTKTKDATRDFISQIWVEFVRKTVNNSNDDEQQNNGSDNNVKLYNVTVIATDGAILLATDINDYNIVDNNGDVFDGISENETLAIPIYGETAKKVLRSYKKFKGDEMFTLSWDGSNAMIETDTEVFKYTLTTSHWLDWRKLGIDNYKANAIETIAVDLGMLKKIMNTVKTMVKTKVLTVHREGLLCMKFHNRESAIFIEIPELIYTSGCVKMIYGLMMPAKDPRLS